MTCLGEKRDYYRSPAHFGAPGLATKKIQPELSFWKEVHVLPQIFDFGSVVMIEFFSVVCKGKAKSPCNHLFVPQQPQPYKAPYFIPYFFVNGILWTFMV